MEYKDMETIAAGYEAEEKEKFLKEQADKGFSKTVLEKLFLKAQCDKASTLLMELYHQKKANCCKCGCELEGSPVGYYFVLDKKGNFYCIHCDQELEDGDERIVEPDLLEGRYEVMLGPSTNQWWVYDNEGDVYIDPPAVVLDWLDVVEREGADTAEEVFQEMVDNIPTWLFDEDAWYDDIEI